jgi:hypothetical protein
MSTDAPSDWPVYVLEDLIGYMQRQNCLKTAELLSDATFSFLAELNQNGIPHVASNRAEERLRYRRQIN